jgi:hypothetical protein
MKPRLVIPPPETTPVTRPGCNAARTGVQAGGLRLGSMVAAALGSERATGSRVVLAGLAHPLAHGMLERPILRHTASIPWRTPRVAGSWKKMPSQRFWAAVGHTDGVLPSVEGPKVARSLRVPTLGHADPSGSARCPAGWASVVAPARDSACPPARQPANG